ncbi:MAG: hypothetical protein PHW04_10530 [Candidatus Wallbacteria bacterium]|nr:hypothetical protein [Candidatus Wallbacteria bacterium]
MRKFFGVSPWLVLTAFALRAILYFYAPPHMSDNLEYIRLAETFKHLAQSGMLTEEEIRQLAWISPLYSLILAFLSIFIARLEILQMIFSFMLDFATYIVLLKYFEVSNPKLKNLASVIYLFSPLLITTFHWALTESLFLLLLSLLLYVWKTGRPVWVMFLLCAFLYLTRPEGILFLIPVIFITVRRWRQFLIGTALFLLLVFPYLLMIRSFSGQAMLSTKTMPFLYGTMLIYHNSYDADDREASRYDQFQRLEWEWIGQTALSTDKGLWVAKSRPEIDFVWYFKGLLFQSYMWFMTNCLHFFVYTLLPLDLIAMLCGLYLVRADRSFFLLFLLPFIVFPIGDLWTELDSPGTRHFAYLYPVFLPHLAVGYRYLADRFKIFNPIPAMIVLFLSTLILHPVYLPSYKQSSYGPNRVFLERCSELDLSNSAIMVRDPWFAYEKQGKWHDQIRFDDNFEANLKLLGIDYVVIDEAYHYFFGKSRELFDKPPPCLEKIFETSYQEYRFIIYKVKKSAGTA